MQPLTATATALDAYTVTGPGWNARFRDGYVQLTVDPERIDVSRAISALLPTSRRRLWTVEFAYEDASGQDVYYLERTEH